MSLRKAAVILNAVDRQQGSCSLVKGASGLEMVYDCSYVVSGDDVEEMWSEQLVICNGPRPNG
jgi:hypothetical protein